MGDARIPISCDCGAELDLLSADGGAVACDNCGKRTAVAFFPASALVDDASPKRHAGLVQQQRALERELQRIANRICELTQQWNRAEAELEQVRERLGAVEQ